MTEKPGPMLPVRSALIGDARTIHEFINQGAEHGEILARSLNDIYESLRDFTLWEDPSGEIRGVCGLHISWAGWAEIRSLFVREGDRRSGIGSALVDVCLGEARRLGADRVFTLTYQPGFFERLGFRRAEKAELPQKIWGDCLHCPKFPDCDEVALVRQVFRGDTPQSSPDGVSGVR